MEGADCPGEEEAGHLEVRFELLFSLFVFRQYLSFTSAVEVVTMGFLVLVASYAWFNGLSKSIFEFAEEN